MLQQARPSRPTTAWAIHEDIENFKHKHPERADATREIRNIFYRCQGKVGYLEDMYLHTQTCPDCSSERVR